jgi:hypothetical protein
MLQAASPAPCEGKLNKPVVLLSIKSSDNSGTQSSSGWFLSTKCSIKRESVNFVCGQVSKVGLMGVDAEVKKNVPPSANRLAGYFQELQHLSLSVLLAVTQY